MISVIGAGPAGSFYSSLEKHDDVTLFEEHLKVGKPFSCSGVLTSEISKLIKLDKDLIVSRINNFKIVSPNGKSIIIPLKHPDFVVDRTLFDQWLLSKAIDSGASIKLGERFVGYKKIGKGYAVKTSKATYNSNMVVGADGPLSPVAKAAGLFGNRKFVSGFQSRCKVPDIEEGTTTIFLNKGEFGWIIPEDDKIARVGVIGKTSPKLWKDYKSLVGKYKIVENISGIVPVYNSSQKFRNGNVFLLGDAALQVKATTYGGILYGMNAAKILAENKESYEKRFKSKFGFELFLGLQIRKSLNSMSYKHLDSLVELFKKDSNSRILSEVSRENPSALLANLLIKEPKIALLGLSILKNRLFSFR